MTDPNQLLQQLAESGLADEDELREFAEEHGIELQTDSEMGMVADLIEQAASEGFDPSDQSVDELRAFIGENLDPSEDAMAAFDDIADAVMEAEEADSEDVVSAEAMADWIAEQMGDEADDDGEDENAGDKDDDEGDDEEMEMSEKLSSIEEQVAANAERIDALAEAQEGIDLAELASKADAVEAKADAETVTELAETVETISENLQEQTSLAAAPGAETNGEESTDGVYMDFGSAEANPNREY